MKRKMMQSQTLKTYTGTCMHVCFQNYVRLDCEQSLSFPSVFLEISSSKRRAAKARAAKSAGAEEKEKERDCGGILIFSICRL